MVKVKLSATIPTHQYANLMPEIEVEAPSYEEALALAEGRLKDIWNRYVESGKELKDGVNERLTAFVGGQIDYDATNHIYSWEGVKYLSGSEYAESFKPPFDKQKIAEAMAKKFSVKAEDIIKYWELRGQASRDLGSAIHAALQLEEEFRGLGETLLKPSVHDHSILKTAVTSFKSVYGHEKALNEVLVVDHAAKRAGRIDRLVLTGDKKCMVDDFKTGATMKDLEYYKKQLEFYQGILEAGGWTVEKRRIHHYNSKWTEYDA